MKGWWRGVRPKLLSGAIYWLARLINATLRLTVLGQPPPPGQRAVIYAGWHGRTLIAAGYFKGQGVWTIISQSRDGELQNRIFRRFGFNTIRGSSGRGGVRAAAEAIRLLRSGATMAFTPDGPRGPSGVCQPGIVLMAAKSGACIVPVGVSARWRWLAPAWDRYMVPLPFSRAIMIFGEPITVEPGADEQAVEAARQLVETKMHEAEREAERVMGH